MVWRGGRSRPAGDDTLSRLEDLEIEAHQIASVDASSISGTLPASAIDGHLQHAAQSGLAAATEALTGPVAGGRLMNDSVPHQALEGAVRGEMARAASLGAAAMRVTPQSADLTQPWHFFRFGLRTTALSGATSLLAGGKASIYLCAGASYTVDLPPVADMKHAVLIFKKTAPGGSITIDADDSETIDGALTKILSNQNDSIIIVCDGSGWHILAGWP